MQMLVVPLVGVLVVQPGGGYPLRLALQQVYFLYELLVGAVRVAVDDDHVEVMAVPAAKQQFILPPNASKKL